jgi:hypothetical protein
MPHAVMLVTPDAVLNVPGGVAARPTPTNSASTPPLVLLSRQVL